MSSTDVDGDYLSYHLCAAFNGATEQNPQPFPPPPPPYETCAYEPPYTFFDPIGSGNIVLDSITGMMSVSPTVSGRFAVAVGIKEFKNGNLISNCYRDFEFDVVECFGLGVSEINAYNISISPNPVENVLVISNDLVGEHIKHINLYSTDGRLLLALDFTNSLIQPKTIDLHDFANGIYILQVRTNKNLFTKSIIKSL